MTSTTQAGFEVTQNRVDPVEFGQVLGLAAIGYYCPVMVVSIGYPDPILITEPAVLIIDSPWDAVHGITATIRTA